jgi:hypothetical protein
VTAGPCRVATEGGPIGTFAPIGDKMDPWQQ